MNKSESKYFNTAVKMDLALISLLKKKTFEYITVSELCETAGVNRSTFYLHYETIGDLLEETARYLLNEFSSYYDINSAEFVQNIERKNEEDLNFINAEYLTPYLTYVKNNKEVFGVALSNKSFLGFEKVYKQMFEHIFNPILEKFEYPEAHRKYVMMYYLNGITAIITKWLEDNCQTSIEDIVRIIEECVFGLRGIK